MYSQFQRKIFVLIFGIFVSTLNITCQNQMQNQKENNDTVMENQFKKSESEWKKTLNDEQYYVLREKGTERPFTGKYNLHFEKGTYTCAGCGYELFTGDQKFESHCGWPSFDNEIGNGERIKKIKDFSHGMIRTEVVCARCNGHLGHLFDDGPTKTGNRYCINSVSIDFTPEEKK